MKITLYVDIVSPFAYIAYNVLKVSAFKLPMCRHAVADRALTSSSTLSLQHDPIFKQCQITYIPIFLGGIMKTAGNTPPIQIKSTCDP